MRKVIVILTLLVTLATAVFADEGELIQLRTVNQDFEGTTSIIYELQRDGKCPAYGVARYNKDGNLKETTFSTSLNNIINYVYTGRCLPGWKFVRIEGGYLINTDETYLYMNLLNALIDVCK